MEKENKHITGNDPHEAVLLKYIRETASEEERMLVEEWLGTNEDRENILLQLAAIDYALRTKKSILSRNSEDAFRKVEKRITLTQRRHWITRVSLAAACLLGVLVLSTAISYWTRNREGMEQIQIVTVQANAGMRTHFNLPDGTVAYLNSGSKLSYPLSYEKNERKVILTGEAYFKVTPDPDRPFIVSVADDRMRVKVLGTEFNLQAYPDDGTVGTTLVSGSVLLEVGRKAGDRRKIKLIPSEKAVLDLHTGHLSVRTVNTQYDTSWKEGRLMFKDHPLPEVLKQLSYFYNVKFEIQTPVINSYCFTGTFENKQLSQVLDYLKISSEIDYKIKNVESDDSHGAQRTTIILKKKD